MLYQGPFLQSAWIEALGKLQREGSFAAPGFTKPEGIVIFHTAASMLFKKTLEKDEMPKALADKITAAA